MTLYVDGINFDEFAVVLRASEPDMVLPTYKRTRHDVFERQLPMYIQDLSKTPGSMDLEFTSLFKSYEQKTRFEEVLDKLFNSRTSKSTFVVKLPSDSVHEYVCALDGQITSDNINYNYDFWKNRGVLVKRYVVPLVIEDRVKK